MFESKTCPKCGRIYHCPPAMSRIDESDICPVCGAMEALEPLLIAEEEKEKIRNKIMKTEHEQGRIDLLPGE